LPFPEHGKVISPDATVLGQRVAKPMPLLRKNLLTSLPTHIARPNTSLQIETPSPVRVTWFSAMGYVLGAFSRRSLLTRIERIPAQPQSWAAPVILVAQNRCTSD
jgi:hypothetical protein